MASPGGPVVISDRAVFVSQVFYGITIPLLVLATVTLGYRMIRVKTRRTLWSDGCVVVGYVLAVACFGLYVPQSFLRPGVKAPEAILEGQKGSFLSIPIWGMSMAFIKASVGLTLLQIQKQTWFKMMVWSNIAASGAYGFGNMWFILFSCRPLQAAWGDFADPTQAVCLPRTHIQKAALTGAVISVVTDVMLSLAPVSFLWSLKRPLRECIVLGCLMSLGMLAGMSSVVKNLIIANFGKEGVDAWAMNISISTWTSCEMLLGIIAACTPFCRPLLEHCVMAMGMSLTGTAKSSNGISKGYAISASGPRAYHRATARETFRSLAAITSHTNSQRPPNQWESDEDPLKSGIEMQVQQQQTANSRGKNNGGSSSSPGSLIVARSKLSCDMYKTTDMRVQKIEAKSEAWLREEQGYYYPGSAV